MAEYGKHFDTLVGKTLAGINRQGDEAIDFITTDNRTLKMYHSQSCCERVGIESVTGDLDDLVGTPILVAEERSSRDAPPEVEAERAKERASGEYYYGPESETWTFYTLRTIKGTVDIRWHGSSNGYYSEEVYTFWDDENRPY